LSALKPVEVARYAQAAGFHGDDLVKAVAHAGAESSFDPTKVNFLTCVGLMQIRQPVHVKAHPTWSVAWLKNPANNMQAAFTLFKESGWAPWAATMGRKELYMKTAEDAVRQLGENPSATTIGGAVGLPDLSGVGGAVVTAKQALELAVKGASWITDPTNWVRVIYVLLGGALVVGALIVVASPTVTPMIRKGTRIASRGLAG
jgi:hypothetical protein